MTEIIDGKPCSVSYTERNEEGGWFGWLVVITGPDGREFAGHDMTKSAARLRAVEYFIRSN